MQSGTVKQSSNFLLLSCYKTMFLITAIKKGFASKEVQRPLGLKRYKLVWSKVHKIKKKYLQLYLNEFVYKLNRRYFGERIFDRLVIANSTELG
ncbi:MAG: hypothetical protein ACI9Q3_000743 [Maribacter sp.]